MAGNFFGADVDQLRQLSRSLAQNAEQVQAIKSRLSPRIDALGWRGPDADRFRSEWEHQLVVSLTAASRALADASGLAERNASQQELASGLGASGASVSGGTGSSGTTTSGAPTISPSFVWDVTREAVNSKSPLFGWRYGDIGGYIPGASDVLTARNVVDSLQQGKVPIHEMVDFAAGFVQKPGPGYLVGAGVKTWNTVAELAGEADFSAQTRATTWNYIVNNPGGAVNAAATAVVENLPRIFSGLKFW